MKKKVGELYDKPIVIGNPNEFTKNEIALNDLEGVDDGMEYYLILKDNDYIHDTLDTYEAVVSTIIIVEDSDKPLLTYYNSPNVAFATSNKVCIGVRNRDTTLKDKLIHSLSVLGYDLNDTSMFKRITAKEYYSLLD